MSGKLSVVATPIGNMEDITLRALRILAEADVIYAEDTRHTSHLLTHHKIHRPLVSCHDFSEMRRSLEVVDRILSGQRVALVSDAGTPGISDPGFRVIRACVEKGVPIEVIPGASAAIAALCISGLPTDEFHFVGFLPPKPGAAQRRLESLVQVPGTLIFYESPHKILRTLGLIGIVFPERMVVVARELTKKFEEVRRGRASEILAHFEAHPPKGEMVVLIGEVPSSRNEEIPEAH